jgi:hypothetical protein
VEILQRVNVYGHLGLAYWGRDFYLDLNDTGGIKAVQRYGDDRQILGIYGLGGSVLLTEHWSVNINYTMARQHVDLPVSGMSTKRYFDPATVVKILSGGIIYHF